MRVLGLETTCDETAAAVVTNGDDGRGAILSNEVLSQIAEHAAYGGVVPEIAARAHVEALDHLIERALDKAQLRLEDVDGIAAAAGPGLIGGLIVGLTTAKALALVARKPLLAVNHLEGHALTARLTDGIGFPYLLLLVSGGHTQLMAVRGGGDPDRFALPRPMLGRPEPNFSLSGLKTALRIEAEKIVPLTDTDVADLCASFQAAVIDVVVDRTRVALRAFRAAAGHPTALVVAGGVAANETMRRALQRLAGEAGLRLVAPPAELCGDNGAIIAWAGLERLRLGLVDDMTVPARARWPLDAARDEAGAKA